MYKEKDVSIIIPTYNRSKDLNLTLKTVFQLSQLPKEVLIIDQSIDKKTKKVCENLQKKQKIIKYYHSSPPSITIARNLGVKNVNKKSNIIFFLDDDVNLDKNYLSKIIEMFNNYPNLKATGTFEPSKIKTKIENFGKKFFFLSYLDKNPRIVSAYGNTYPENFDKILESDWLQGMNMIYKKEVFKEQKFDENLLGYTVAEDIDFSYRLSKKYPQSILITPFAKLIHRSSKIERPIDRKINYINQIDHFYFFFKNLNTSIQNKFIFLWSLFGIFFMRSFLAFSKSNKKNILQFLYFLESLFYCLANLTKIRKGILRDWIKH